MLALYHNDMSLCAQKVRVCLAEKKLEWESRHLKLRAGDHQQPWYRKLNRRAVVPTLVDGDNVIPELNIILEYLDESFPEPALAPKDPYGRAKMRLWTKQLDEDIHDASAAVMSFGIAFRQQYLDRGEAGMKMLEEIPNMFKRERRRDVIEKGTGSQHFIIAVRRMVLLLDEMEEALRAAPVARRRSIYVRGRGVHAVSRPPRAFERRRRMLGERRHVAEWYAPLQGAAELPGGDRTVGEYRLPRADEGARRRGLAAAVREIMHAL